MATTGTDRIEKKVLLKAPRARVWRALTDAKEFGDYSSEPTTLVVFELEESGQGTMLTVVESGFDRIPLARCAEAYRMNDQGWAEQMKSIEGHVAQES